MKILFNAWRDGPHPRAGGSEMLVNALASGLHQRGHDVALLCGGPVADHAYPVIDAGGTFTQYLRAPVLYHRHLLDRDLVVDVSNGMTFFSPLWRRRPTICLVHHVHTDQWGEHFPSPIAWLGRRIESRAMPFVYRNALYVTVSTSTSDDLQALGVDPDRIRVIPQSIEAPCPTAERSPEPLFLALGRLAHHKRIDLLLDLWEQVRAEVGGRLVIAGDGPERDRLVRRAPADVEFAGLVDEAEKRRLYSSAWLLVHPAAREGWGLVISEAASYGTPTIGFDVKGVRDAVDHGRTGLLASDERDFVALWRRLGTDAELRATLGSAARDGAMALTESATVDHFEAIAEEAVAERYLPDALRPRGPMSAHRSTQPVQDPLPLPDSPRPSRRSIIDLSIVVPAWNEELRLPRLLTSLVHAVDVSSTEIIVVDDGSTDGTAAIAAAILDALPYARVERLATNCGKGAAVRHGVLAARGTKIAYMDADMATDLDDLSRLVAALDQSHVVVGSRSADGADARGGKLYRAWMGNIFNALARLLTQLPMRDTQCGFKGFRAPAAKLLFSLSRVNGFAFDVEILHLARRLGLTTAELGVRWNGVDGSKVRVVRDSVYMAVDVVRSTTWIRHTSIPALRVQSPVLGPEALQDVVAPLVRAGDFVVPWENGVVVMFPGSHEESRAVVRRRIEARHLGIDSEPVHLSASALMAVSGRPLCRAVVSA